MSQHPSRPRARQKPLQWYPLVSELAADGIPVAVSMRVLKLSRAPSYRWLRRCVTDSELIEAYRANALFDAHRDDPEFGYRFLRDEAVDAGEPMAARTAWRICRDNCWWSTFGKKRGGAPDPHAPAGQAACWRVPSPSPLPSCERKTFSSLSAGG